MNPELAEVCPDKPRSASFRAMLRVVRAGSVACTLRTVFRRSRRRNRHSSPQAPGRSFGRIHRGSRRESIRARARSYRCWGSCRGAYVHVRAAAPTSLRDPKTYDDRTEGNGRVSASWTWPWSHVLLDGSKVERLGTRQILESNAG